MAASSRQVSGDGKATIWRSEASQFFNNAGDESLEVSQEYSAEDSTSEKVRNCVTTPWRTTV